MTIQERNEIALKYLDLVRKIARSLRNNSCYSHEDMVQDGFIKLLEAIPEYEKSDKSIDFIKFVSGRVKRGIIWKLWNYNTKIEYMQLDENYDTIDITTKDNLEYDKELLFSYISKQLTYIESNIIKVSYGLIGRDMSDREIAKQFKISRNTIRKIKNDAIDKLKHPNSNNSRKLFIKLNYIYLKELKTWTEK